MVGLLFCFPTELCIVFHDQPSQTDHKVKEVDDLFLFFIAFEIFSNVFET